MLGKPYCWSCLLGSCPPDRLLRRRGPDVLRGSAGGAALAAGACGAAPTGPGVSAGRPGSQVADDEAAALAAGDDHQQVRELATTVSRSRVRRSGASPSCTLMAISPLAWAASEVASTSWLSTAVWAMRIPGEACTRQGCGQGAPPGRSVVGVTGRPCHAGPQDGAGHCGGPGSGGRGPRGSAAARRLAVEPHLPCGSPMGTARGKSRPCSLRAARSLLLQRSLSQYHVFFFFFCQS